MTAKLSTTVKNIEKHVSNEENVKLIFLFFEFMKKYGTSEGYQNNNLKAIIDYSKSLGPSISLDQIKTRNQITSFLDTKIKPVERDPDKRWITSWNDYLGRIKFFFRWLHNYDDNRFADVQFSRLEPRGLISVSSITASLIYKDFFNLEIGCNYLQRTFSSQIKI